MRETYVMYAFKGDVREVAGFAFTKDNTDTVLLSGPTVLDNWRGAGHGRALLRLVCVHLDRERRDCLLTLDPDPDMDIHRLHNLFEEFGFFSLGDDGVTMKREWKKF